MVLALAFSKDTDFDEKIVDVRVHLQRPIADVFSGFRGKLPERIEKGFELLQKSEAGVLFT